MARGCVFRHSPKSAVPPQIPGPIIRVREGTEIRVAVRNVIAGATLLRHGLHARPGSADDAIQLAPGERREVRFRTGSPGTYDDLGDHDGKSSPGSLRRRQPVEWCTDRRCGRCADRRPRLRHGLVGEP